MAKASAEVLERIREAKERKDGILNLVYCELTEIPEEVFELRELRELSLHFNHLTKVSNLHERLPRLQYLDLRENPLRSVADQPGLGLDYIAYVRIRDRLSTENVAGLYVEALSPSVLEDILGCKNLRRLGIHSTELDRIPDSISQLALEELEIPESSIREIPDLHLHFPKLRSLELTNGKIDRVPPGLGKLAELRFLILRSNSISQIPDELAALRNLEHLDLSQNPLRQVPEWILSLPKLRGLYLTGTSVSNVPTEFIPPNFWESLDLARLRAYFRDLNQTGLDYLCEAKLLVVGEGDAGKTTLAKKVLDRGYTLRADEPSTEGIEVHAWSFPAKVPVEEDGNTRYLDRDITVRIWDFAGQEITHATHQFFLTKRSLYALVVNSRRDNPNFDYWLGIVELLSESSPVLIVKNEKQDASCFINESAARARFSNVKEVLAVNLGTNRGLDAVAAALRNHVQSLPHIGTPLPASWKRVREALAERNENYISSEAFFAMCDANGFKGHDDKLQLSGYLHDLGVFLHFKDDLALASTIILKTEWVTRSVYRVLRDRSVLERQGRFERRELERIWHEPEYAPVRGLLLELMRKFRLCYPLGESGEFIVPHLLSLSQPEYPWDARDNLQIQYEYDFMPKGILSRLIVALHRVIERQAWVWQEGVVLARDGARAEVIEESSRRTIRLRLAGKNRLQLLGAVVHALDEIHAAYRGLAVHKRIPCQCEECLASDSPHFFDARALRTLAEKGVSASQCQKSGEMVAARELLAAVGEDLDDVLREFRFTTVSQPLAGFGRRAAERFLFGFPSREEAPTREPSSIFVSYAWGGESETVVDRIEQAFQARGVRVSRDKKDAGYKSDIAAFMQRLSEGDQVIVVISDRYLRSQFCMAELVGIADSSRNGEDFVKRIFPVVLDDAKLYVPRERIEYVRHWEKERDDLDREMRTLDQNNLEGFREDIDLYEKIRNELPRITDLLRKLNALSIKQHEGEGFETLLERVLSARVNG